MLLCFVCLDEHSAGYLWPLLQPKRQAVCGDCGRIRECVDAPQTLVTRITRKD